MPVNLVTKEGLERMRRELEGLIAQRPEIAERIGQARSHGDLSENAEFDAAREAQGILEAKIRQLEQQIKNSKIANDDAVPDGQVTIGSTVKVQEVANGRTSMFQVLGEGEAKFDPDAEVMQVSVTSPVGSALFKARLGDTVGVRTPRGRVEYKIVEVS